MYQPWRTRASHPPFASAASRRRACPMSICKTDAAFAASKGPGNARLSAIKTRRRRALTPESVSSEWVTRESMSSAIVQVLAFQANCNSTSWGKFLHSDRLKAHCDVLNVISIATQLRKCSYRKGAGSRKLVIRLGPTRSPVLRDGGRLLDIGCLSPDGRTPEFAHGRDAAQGQPLGKFRHIERLLCGSGFDKWDSRPIATGN